MNEPFLLKDHLFNQGKAARIARELHEVYASFNRDGFVRDVVSRFPELELKARIAWIAECLHTHLPNQYNEAIGIILASLPEENNPELTDDDFGDYIYASYSHFVAQYGCSQEHLRVSLGALREITKRFSAEDAIRYFLNAFADETMDVLLQWTSDPHYHVRRLCSEGTRPRLPWSRNIAVGIDKPIAILDKVFHDRTRYVTRSVANHVNDISKADAPLAINTLIRWQQMGLQTTDEMNYIIRHALRTLIKQGHPQALSLLGYPVNPPILVSELQATSTVRMNSALEFSVTLTATDTTTVLVDYIVYFQSKAGKAMNKKVFKLAVVTIEKGSDVTLTKRHVFRENMTTRTLYRGIHHVEIQVNGTVCAKTSFTLY